MKQIFSQISEFMNTEEMTDLFLIVIGSFAGAFAILTVNFGLSIPETMTIINGNLGQLLTIDFGVFLALYVLRFLFSLLDDAKSGRLFD